MTDAKPDLLALAQRAKTVADRATPGPWVTEPPETPAGETFARGVLVAATAPNKGNRVYADPPGGSYPSADRDFIAFAREALPALASGVEELMRERAAFGKKVADVYERDTDRLSEFLARAESAEARLAEVEHQRDNAGVIARECDTLRARLAEVERERDNHKRASEVGIENIKNARDAQAMVRAEIEEHLIGALPAGEYVEPPFTAEAKLQVEAISRLATERDALREQLAQADAAIAFANSNVITDDDHYELRWWDEAVARDAARKRTEDTGE